MQREKRKKRNIEVNGQENIWTWIPRARTGVAGVGGGGGLINLEEKERTNGQPRRHGDEQHKQDERAQGEGDGREEEWLEDGAGVAGG
jgi:hypothetical protein